MELECRLAHYWLVLDIAELALVEVLVDRFALVAEACMQACLEVGACKLA